MLIPDSIWVGVINDHDGWGFYASTTALDLHRQVYYWYVEDLLHRGNGEGDVDERVERLATDGLYIEAVSFWFQEIGIDRHGEIATFSADKATLHQPHPSSSAALPTPSPWRFTGELIVGPPLAHPHDPAGRLYVPATLVAILPANLGGRYDCYPPDVRDANGRAIAALPTILDLLRSVAEIGDGSEAASVAERARELREYLGLPTIGDGDEPNPSS